jgi:hypothetical protein
VLRASGDARRPDAVADLIGSVDGLLTDLAGRKKEYLRDTRYGQKRPR